MIRLRTASLSRALFPLVAAVAVLAVAGCASTGASGEGVVTAVEIPTESVAPLSDAALAVLVAPRVTAFEKAARSFRTCDRKVDADSNKAYPCLKKAAAEIAVVDAALADLDAITVPPSYAGTVKNLERLSTAGKAVATRCKKANDQKCDQALARFRADEQSLIWDLDAKL